MKHDLRMVDTCPSIPTSFIDNKGRVHKPRPQKYSEEDILKRKKSVSDRWDFIKTHLTPDHLTAYPHFTNGGQIYWEKLEAWKEDDILMMSLCNKL